MTDFDVESVGSIEDVDMGLDLPDGSSSKAAASASFPAEDIHEAASPPNPGIPFKEHPADTNGRRLKRITKAKAELDEAGFTYKAAHKETHSSRLAEASPSDISSRQNQLELDMAKNGVEGGIGIHLQRVQWPGANLKGAHLEHVDLTCANLSRAEMQEASLDEASLENANLAFAKLCHASLQHAVACSADLRNVDASHCNLQFASLGYATCTDASFEGANLFRAKLRYCNLANADLSGACLARASLYGANLERAKLDCADLRGADLSHACLAGCSLSDAKLDGVTIDAETDFSGAESTLSPESKEIVEHARRPWSFDAHVPTKEDYPEIFRETAELKVEKVLDGVRSALQPPGGREAGWCEGMQRYSSL